MKEFEINIIYNKGTPTEFVGSPQVSDYPEYAVGDPSYLELVKPNEKITDASIIRIMFDYPLSHSVTLLFTNDGGFTRLEFYRAIYEGYTTIYREERGDVGDPGNLPGLLNRAPSHGRHGIWGHGIGDLCIEAVTHVGNDVYHLSIGS